MTPLEIMGRIVGAFYVFAGVVLIRAVRIGALSDRVLATLTGERTSFKGRFLTAFGWGMALFCLSSGGALLLLSRWAVPLFLVCAVAQAAYLLWASRWDRPETPEEALGRRRTVNAFAGYVAATGLVLYLQRAGVLG